MTDFTFRIDRDRMHLIWSPGYYEPAHEFLIKNGFDISVASGGESMVYRCHEGWERRIIYKSKQREKEKNAAKERSRKKSNAGIEGES